MKGKTREVPRRGNISRVILVSCVVGAVVMLGIPLDITAALLIGTAVGLYGLSGDNKLSCQGNPGRKEKRNVGK